MLKEPNWYISSVSLLPIVLVSFSTGLFVIVFHYGLFIYMIVSWHQSYVFWTIHKSDQLS